MNLYLQILGKGSATLLIFMTDFVHKFGLLRLCRLTRLHSWVQETEGDREWEEEWS